MEEFSLKAEVEGSIIRLIPESEQERYELEKLDKEGVWVCGTVSSGAIHLCSAKYSGYTALLIDEYEKAIIAFALGESKLSLSELPVNLEPLKAKLFRRPKNAMPPMPELPVVGRLARRHAHGDLRCVGDKCPGANPSECVARTNGLPCPTFNEEVLRPLREKNPR